MIPTIAFLAKQRIGILEGRSPPFWVLKIVGEESHGCGLLLVPAGHSPKALKHCFLPQC